MLKSLRLIVSACALVLVFSLQALAGTKAPIVFAHGVGVPPVLYERIVPIRRIFHELGYEAYVARTPIGGSLEERARVLAAEIDRLVPPGEKFHLVGHSMGGLDARLAVQRPDLKERCLSVTTLATPHQGSAVADFVADHLDELASKSSLVRAIVDLFGGDLRAIRDLTTRHMSQEFNSQVDDVPGVRYFSMGFYIPEPADKHSMVPLLWVLHRIAGGKSSDRNDGLVTVASADWGQSLGVYPADHWSETAPIPFLGGKNYKDILARVAENLDESFF